MLRVDLIKRSVTYAYEAYGINSLTLIGNLCLVILTERKLLLPPNFRLSWASICHFAHVKQYLKWISTTIFEIRLSDDKNICSNKCIASESPFFPEFLCEQFKTPPR
jgi:uncharacterized membrane protein